jgi:hypothetical protein
MHRYTHLGVTVGKNRHNVKEKSSKTTYTRRSEHPNMRFSHLLHGSVLVAADPLQSTIRLGLINGLSIIPTHPPALAYAHPQVCLYFFFHSSKSQVLRNDLPALTPLLKSAWLSFCVMPKSVVLISFSTPSTVTTVGIPMVL